MRTHRLIAYLVAVGLLAGTHIGANAQTGSPTTKKPGLMHRMLHGRRPTGTAPMMHGRIIGNKRTHVYHLPGDKGSLPSEKNRIYFKSESEARTAGYRPAGHSPMTGHTHGSGSAASMSHNRMQSHAGH